MQCLRTGQFEFPDPALVNAAERDRIEEVPFLAPLPLHRDKIGLLEKLQVLRCGLARHGEPPAQLPQCLAALLIQTIEKSATIRICESPEDPIVGDGTRCELWNRSRRLHERYYMQSNTCMSILPYPYRADAA